MLTVLAIDKNIICELDEFESLFSNVQKRGEFKICSWNRDGKDLFESIPALFDRHFISENELKNWNIIIVSGDRNCNAFNPFGGDYLNDKDNLPDPEINEVAKMLGIVPTDSHSSYEIPQSKFGNIKWNVEVNRSLRNEKLQQYSVNDFSRPQKIYLWSVVRKNDVDVDEFSKEKADSRSTMFNFRINARYPVNCRFLRFNLSSVSNMNTREDYFRLWMALLAFVYNKPDDLFLAPDVLYNVDCDIDRKVLKDQISTIYSQVHYVKKYTKLKISEIEKKRSQILQKHYDIPNLSSNVNVVFDVDDNGLYLDTKKFGLAKDCPREDEPEYKFQREIIEQNIFKFLKVPKRAVKRAVGETKRKGEFIPLSQEKIHLDENQTEDLNEKIDNLEIELFGTDAVDADYYEKNRKEREKSDEETLKTMKKRSTVAVVVLGSLVAFLAVLIGFVPYIINAFIDQDSKTIADSLMVTFITLFVMMVAGIVTLVVMRAPLSLDFKNYNSLIKTFVNDIRDSAKKYTIYLSKFSSYMKMNSFKNYLKEESSIFMKEEEDMFLKNQMYCEKIESMCQNWGKIFDFELKYNEKKADKNIEIDEYPEKNPLYSFVIKSGDYKLLLNKTKSNLSSPYKFINSVNILLEEDAE